MAQSKSLIIILTILLIPIIPFANPWLPEVEGWKYNFSYSKYYIPNSIKFYERDIYFALEKIKALEYKKISDEYKAYTPIIDTQKQNIIALNNTALTNLESNLINQGVNLIIRQKIIQDAKNALYANNNDLQIIYNRLNNSTSSINRRIRQIENIQNYLILSYHKWSAKTSIEYGLSNYFSYGIDIGCMRGVSKYNTNTKLDEVEIFTKAKLYENKGYIFTIQPKIIATDPMKAVDFTIMLGKSHSLERKIFGKSVEIFGYSAFGITHFIEDNPLMKKKIHGEITSGIKFNDRFIIMNQESEDINPHLGKVYKRVLRSQFTIAQDINFANIEHHNKVYLAFSYFRIDSMKAKRSLSSGCSIGLWLEL